MIRPFLLAVSLATLTSCASSADSPAGQARVERIRKSPHYKDGKFINALPAKTDFWDATMRWMTEGSDYRVPEVKIPTLARKRADFDAPPASGLRATWLGHSTVLVEIGGRRILTDPVWGERASPVGFVGPSRFFAPPLPLAELPHIDAIVLSHDHYDHLDAETIEAMARLDTTFVAPLGVGGRIAAWGVPEAKIVELDWWETHTVGGVELTCAPARHFSGRSLTDGDSTLWAGWAIRSEQHRVFFSGDTGMFPGFKEIGTRLGPFDLTLMESGAYSDAWPDVHLGPEQAMAAHLAVGGRVILPVHWATFNLALHGWTEPVERLRVAAAAAGTTLVAPRPGESLEPGAPPAVTPWWPTVPWQTAQEAPVVSTGL